MNQKINVIVVSVEKTATSFFCGILSEVFKQIYQCPIEWNYEISRLVAISLHYETPKDFNTVYYINPKQLLQKKYDKIIVLERRFEHFIRALVLNHIGKYYEEIKDDPKYQDYFLKAEWYWKLVYGEKVNDPRVKYIHLDDINNFSIATFNEVFEFLEFAKPRPVLIPFPVRRDWEIYSSILPKGWGLDYRQLRILGLTPDSREVKEQQQSTQYVNIPTKELKYPPTQLEMEVQGGRFRLFYDKPVPDVLKQVGLI